MILVLYEIILFNVLILGKYQVYFLVELFGPSVIGKKKFC